MKIITPLLMGSLDGGVSSAPIELVTDPNGVPSVNPGGGGNPGGTPGGTLDFRAALTQGPANNATISGTVTLTISGAGIRRAILVPQNSLTPVYANLIPSVGNNSASVNFNTTSLPNGTSSYRVIAYDYEEGGTGQEIVVFTRTFTISNQAPVTSFEIDYFGDSTIWGYLREDVRANPTPVAEFARILNGNGSGNTYNVANRGVSGQGTGRLLGTVDPEYAGVPALSAILDQTTAKYAIFNHLLNDVTDSGQEPKSVEAYKSNLRAIVSLCRSKGRTVIFETSNPSYYLALDLYVQGMRDVATELSVPLIDQFQMIADYRVAQGNPGLSTIVPDGLHPSQEIYNLKADYAATRFAEITGGTPFVPPIIGYYGDSTVWGVDGSSGGRAANPVPEQVAASTGWTVENLGVVYQTTTQLLNGGSSGSGEGTATVGPWADTMAASSATVVIMNHGINDWDLDETNYKAALRQVYDIAVAAGKTMIFETPNPTFQELWGGSAASDAEVASKATWMKAVAAEKGAQVIDQFAMLTQYFVDSGTTAAQLTPDGGHPTQAGYNLKATLAISRLQEIFPSSGGGTGGGGVSENVPPIKGPTNVGDFEVTFFDDFDGGQLSNKWNKGDVWSGGIPNNTMRVTSGELQMCVQPESMFTGGNRYNYCIVDTNPKSGMGAAGGFEQKFGVFQIEARMPVGRGLWPSFWLFNYMGNNRPEVDIFEAYPGGQYDWTTGSPPRCYRGDVSIHPMYADETYVAPGANANAKLWTEFDASADFHTYTFEWDTGYMKAYMDGVLKFTTTNSATLNYMNQFPLFIMLQLGINYGTAVGPSSDPAITPTGFGSDPSNPPANLFRVKYCAAWQFKKHL